MPSVLRTEVSQNFDLLCGMLIRAYLKTCILVTLSANTETSHQSDTDLMMYLGKPRCGDVLASPGCSLTSRIPKYLVTPTSLPSSARDAGSCLVKIIDFGGASSHGQQRQIHCPLVFRAPEAVLTGQWDSQADIWSLGCTVCGSCHHISRLLTGGKDIRVDRWIPSFQ